jgi:uncharacterized protein (TIGR02594 family)
LNVYSKKNPTPFVESGVESAIVKSYNNYAGQFSFNLFQFLEMGGIMTKQIAKGCLSVKKDPISGGAHATYIFKNDFFDALGTSADGLWLKVLTTSGVQGWIRKSRWFESVPEENIAKTVDPPWLQLALNEFKAGVKELPDPEENPRILEYLATAAPDPLWASSDETDWCSAFANWCFEQCGIKGTGSLAAKSWLGFGDGIANPRRGCVVVFDRPPEPANGHVAFYIGEAPGKHGGSIAVLGGNQGNTISIASYAGNRLRGFRWPSKEDYPDNP